jgi:hypothetical protein
LFITFRKKQEANFSKITDFAIFFSYNIKRKKKIKGVYDER